MKDKFTMELTWHNCLTDPPKKSSCYIAANEYGCFFVEYVRPDTCQNQEDAMWLNMDPPFLLVDKMSLTDCYWADLDQLTHDFKEAKLNADT
jgi:hypothetical protein